MSDVVAALAGLKDAIESLPQRHMLPTESHRATHKAMLVITQGRDPPPAEPKRDRLDQVWAVLRQGNLAGRDPADLPASTLRDAAWLLWDLRRGVVGMPGLLDAIINQAEEHRSTLRCVIEAWLRDFDPLKPGVAQVGGRIASALRAHTSGTLGSWREAHVRYGLFDAAKGPGVVAHALLTEASVNALTQARLDEPTRTTGGFLRHVTAAFSQSLPQELRRGDARKVAALAQDFYAPAGQLRFDEPAASGAMADALVGAWIGGRGPDSARSDILAYLRHHLGDPRIRPVRWAQARPETLGVVRAWLAQLTLDAFFSVIGQFAGQAGMGHQWEARRKFWLACLRKGWISDSWLVVGDNVRRSIAASRELKESYGSLRDPPSENHSVLLMRIGNILFAEWSHNGKLRAWPIDGRNVPRLPLTGSYDAQALRTPCLEFPPPDNRPDLRIIDSGGLIHSAVWQGRVAALLRRREGLRLAAQDWS